MLVLVNNGYSTLNQRELLALAERRVRNDTSGIDELVVAGCYYHGDSFDSYFLWPMDHVVIRGGAESPAFTALKVAWNQFAEKFMLGAVRTMADEKSVKGPVADVSFEYEGRTFVKPAPKIGGQWEDLSRGLRNSVSLGKGGSPTVALTFPEIAASEWSSFSNSLDASDQLAASYTEWMAKRAAHESESDPLKIFAPVPVKHIEWLAWLDENSLFPTANSIGLYANEEFEKSAQHLLEQSRERTPTGLLPSRYVLVQTEEIGQDPANDVSHIVLIHESMHLESSVTCLLKNVKIPHDHALLLGCAYATSCGVEAVLWETDRRYAWP